MKKGWTEVALGDVATVVSGATPKTSEPEFWGGEIPWVTPKDLSDLDGGKYLAGTPRTLTAEGLNSCAASMLPAGSVLLSSRAPIGLVAINQMPVATNQGFKSLVPRATLDPSYLYWWLRTHRRTLESLGRGATFKEVSKAIVEEVEIPLPPLEEQKRIAAILDKADELLAKRRAAIAHLDSLTQASFSQRFRELMANGNPVELDTVIDADRPVCYGILMPGPDLEGGRPYVRVVDMQDGGIGHEQVRRTSPEIDHQYRRSRLSAGDLLMSIRGHVGRLAVVPPELDGANITQDSARLAVSGADSRFVLEQLRHPMTQEWMRRNTKGAAVRGLNIGDLRRVPIFLAPMPEQEAFAAVCRQVDLEAQPTREAAKRQNELTATLQSRAFRGEL